jgi:hypothetical protein
MNGCNASDRYEVPVASQANGGTKKKCFWFCYVIFCLSLSLSLSLSLPFSPIFLSVFLTNFDWQDDEKFWIFENYVHCYKNFF